MSGTGRAPLTTEVIIRLHVTFGDDDAVRRDGDTSEPFSCADFACPCH